MPLPKPLLPPGSAAHVGAPPDANIDAHNSDEELRSSFVALVNQLLGAGERTSSFSKNDKELGFVLGPPALELNAETLAAAQSAMGERFSVKRAIGRGGFGTVYLAHDESLDRDVAIKIPHEKLRSDPHLSSQCLKEARLAAKLRHPSIVTIFDISEDQGRIAYIVQEFVEGATLHDVINKQRLSIRQSIHIIIKVAEAIQFAHARGVYHRDLKPANLMVDESGDIRVLDFGLAVDEEMQRSARGQIAGTIAYMSPEQLEGRTHHLDGRTDIWSLGVIFYELLAGRRPFRGNQDEVADQIVKREAPPPRQFLATIPKRVEACCLKCLEKSVSARYGTALDLVEDLKGIIETEDLPEELPSGPLPTIPQHDTKKLGKDTTKDLPKSVGGRIAAGWLIWSSVLSLSCLLLLAIPAASMLLASKEKKEDDTPRTTEPPKEQVEVNTKPKAINGFSSKQDHNLFTDGWSRLIGAEQSTSASSDTGKLVVQSTGDCALLFSRLTSSQDFDFHIQIREVPWNGFAGLIYGAKQSKKDTSKWLAHVVWIQREAEREDTWKLIHCHIVIDTVSHQVEQIMELSEPIYLERPPDDLQTFMIQVRNGVLMNCNFDGNFSAKIALSQPRDVAYVQATTAAHQLLPSLLQGKCGILLSRSNATIDHAVVVEYFRK